MRILGGKRSHYKGEKENMAGRGMEATKDSEDSQRLTERCR